MNTKTIFLSVDYLKENSVIDYNVEDNILESSILDSQNIDIQGIIGSSLYVKMLDLVSNNTIGDSGNTDFKTLLDDYIVPTQLKFSLYRCVMPMRIHFRNKGLMENNSDNSESVDKSLVTYVENKFRNDAEFYSQKLKSYLCDFFTTYPEYDCDTSESQFNTPNKSNTAFCGIYLKN